MLGRLLIIGGIFLLSWSATAQEVALVPLAYHPYPDDADPLGVPYWVQGDQSWGYFQGAYARLDQDRDGFDFPSLVTDGINLLEGVAAGDHESTLAAYRGAWQERRAVPSPLDLMVNTSSVQDGLQVTVAAQAAGPVDDAGLRLHWALAEDDVYYRPPPALSNGVFVHRFTVRAINDWPPVAVDLEDGRFEAQDTIALDPTWNRDRLYVAVWVQNHAEANGAFALGEVLQATRHDVDGPATHQPASMRGVLMEMFTATWCPACLFGDEALNDLAAEAGFASEAYREPPWRYLRSPEWLRLATGAGLGALLGAATLWSARPAARRPA